MFPLGNILEILNACITPKQKREKLEKLGLSKEQIDVLMKDRENDPGDY